MPASIFGMNQYENPFSFGSAIPFLDISWSISNPEIISTEGPLGTSNILEGPSNKFSLRLRAQKTGQVMLRVSIRPVLAALDPSEQQVSNAWSQILKSCATLS